ncbi:hypothetical protein ACH4OW_33820 [Streptomyces sp. NPDC017056]|uniref:hypothetical protein n=1 Tax=Streptomyces sp. NPDC017056 TaxID=3364973 RepID=UPI0037A94937
MGWVDPQYAHLLREDSPYGRMINVPLHLLRERERQHEGRGDTVSTCGSYQGGQITVRAADGTETTVLCQRCGGTGAGTRTVPESPDDPHDGAAGGYEPDLG